MVWYFLFSNYTVITFCKSQISINQAVSVTT